MLYLRGISDSSDIFPPRRTLYIVQAAASSCTRYGRVFAWRPSSYPIFLPHAHTLPHLLCLILAGIPADLILDLPRQLCRRQPPLLTLSRTSSTQAAGLHRRPSPPSTPTQPPLLPLKLSPPPSHLVPHLAHPLRQWSCAIDYVLHLHRLGESIPHQRRQRQDPSDDDVHATPHGPPDQCHCRQCRRLHLDCAGCEWRVGGGVIVQQQDV